MTRLARRQVAATALVFGVAVAAALLLSPTWILGRLSALAERPLLFGAALLVVYLVRPLVAWPVSPISAVVGYVLGVTYGVPVALAGAVLTCLPPFLVARHVGDGRGEGRLARLCRTGRRAVDVTGATRGVLAARLSPVPADPVSYGAGFSGVPTRAFVVGTLVGEVPWVILEVLAGASMHHVTADGLGAGVHLLAASAAVAGLVLAGPAYRYFAGDATG